MIGASFQAMLGPASPEPSLRRLADFVDDFCGTLDYESQKLPSSPDCLNPRP